MTYMKKNSITRKAAAVAALEAGLKPADQVARAASVSKATVYNWKREAANNPELSEIVQQKRAELAAKMEALAAGIADKLLTDLNSVTWDNKAGTVLGIVTDKWLALTGQPSTITESRVSGSIDLLVEARQALRLYQAEGFGADDAMQCLRDDDPELYRALLSASHAPGPGPVIDVESGDSGGESGE